MTVKSLWGEAFNLPSETDTAKRIITKVASASAPVVKKTTKKSTLSIPERLAYIYENVKKTLGKFAERTTTLRTRKELHSYIDAAIQNGVIDIDTETNRSLDPLTCKLMGPCIYTPGQKNAYIPINHVDWRTGERLQNQLTEEDVKEEFERLVDTRIIMHNGKFDYQVIKCTTGCVLNVYWDTMIAAKILDSTERAGLKAQYISKVDSSLEKYSIETFFSEIPYEFVDPEIFALYAATDAFMTHGLYEYQKHIFERPENKGLYNVFMDVEMPVLIPTAEMELNGVAVDIEYAKRLSVKYHAQADKIDAAIEKELIALKLTIDQWRLTPDANVKPPKKRGKGLGKSKNEQLSDPVAVTSPTQLAILLYDILQIPAVDKKSPRSTGQDILERIKHPICRLIVQKRGVEKLLSTYIDKIPEIRNPKDGKVHTHFNQTGTETGRYSSSDPINLQNIPSHEKSIRMIFQASPGYVMIGSDFSSQEPRLLATYSKDANMRQAFIDNKDLYAIVAEKVYNNRYEDNLQEHADGSPFPEGKKRRSNCKSILLGIMYGRGVASIAEQIGKSTEEAQEILDKFYREFPAVKEWTEKTQADAHKNGYVEDLWGRRRQLPDIQRPPYEVRLKDAPVNNSFNPLFDTRGILQKYLGEISPLVLKYQKLTASIKNRQDADNLKKKAALEGVEILNNQGFIAEAERQSVNARIQGGAASMSKKAIAALYRDPEMRQLGFRLLIMVHDELIGECPVENRDKALARLSYIMSKSGEPEVSLPMKCDAVAFSHWYEDEYTDMVCEEFDEMKAAGKTIPEILSTLQTKHCETLPEDLNKMLESRLTA